MLKPCKRHRRFIQFAVAVEIHNLVPLMGNSATVIGRYHLKLTGTMVVEIGAIREEPRGNAAGPGRSTCHVTPRKSYLV